MSRYVAGYSYGSAVPSITMQRNRTERVNLLYNKIRNTPVFTPVGVITDEEFINALASIATIDDVYANQAFDGWHSNGFRYREICIDNWKLAMAQSYPIYSAHYQERLIDILATLP